MEHNIPIRTRPAATTCRFFASGRCAKGTSCPFPHVTPRDMARPEQNTVQQYSKKAVTCHYFLAGACKRGDACVFLHQTPARTEIEDAEASADADATVPRSSQLPCRYFARGECRSGEACLFQHDASQAPSRVIDGYAEQPDVMFCFFPWSPSHPPSDRLRSRWSDSLHGLNRLMSSKTTGRESLEVQSSVTETGAAYPRSRSRRTFQPSVLAISRKAAPKTQSFRCCVTAASTCPRRSR